MLRLSAFVLVVTSLLCLEDAEARKVYLWKDARGVPHISDIPPKNMDDVRDLKQMEYQDRREKAEPAGIAVNAPDGVLRPEGEDPLKQVESIQNPVMDKEIEAEINRIKSRLDDARSKEAAR